MTLSQALKSMRTVIAEGHDTSSISLDARLIACFVMKVDTAQLLNRLNDSVTRVQEVLMLELAQQRAQGKPIAYIVGHKEFMGLDFFVDERVLIPRPDTECLVGEALDYIQQKTDVSQPFFIHDCCTGSGCIITALAFFCKSEWPRLHFSASDISQDALDVAARNLARLVPACEHILVKADLLQDVDVCRQTADGRATFDLICSNPPYLPQNQLDPGMPASYWGEPRIALDGGKDGLDLYRDLIPQAYKRLRNRGALFLEIGDQQENLIKVLLECTGFSDIVTKVDLTGNPRCLLALK